MNDDTSTLQVKQYTDDEWRAYYNAKYREAKKQRSWIIGWLFVLAVAQTLTYLKTFYP
jgi:hypothetical protein